MNRLKVLVAAALLGLPLAACEEGTAPPPVGEIEGQVVIEGEGMEGISVQELGAPDLDRRLFAVEDRERQDIHLVSIGRVNDAWPRPCRRVVRFSEREHSPRLSSEIWVSTLARYRDGDLEGDRSDPMEGQVKLDASPFLARSVGKKGVYVSPASFTATITASSPDLWVFCTSVCPVIERDAYHLARRISPDYDTITDILDVDAFALELGVDFVLALDEPLHTKTDSAFSWIPRRAMRGGFQKVVHIVHGPVAYEDISGTFDTGSELVDLASRAGFIKPTALSYQSEYRFALRTSGEPVVDTLRIPASEALRECTSLRRNPKWTLGIPMVITSNRVNL